MVLACNSYHPPAIAADVTVVRAAKGTVGEFAGHPDRAAPDWGWSRVTSGATTATALPGTHYSLLNDRGLAADVARLLNRR